MRLNGKVALIVGAGGGMGSAVPWLFAREGANVVLGARRLEPLDELATRIRAHLSEGAGEIACATGDALTSDGCAALVAGAIQHFGKLDVLYCNVGDNAFSRRPPDELDDEAWGYLVGVNLTSNFLPVRQALPELRKTGGSAILVAAAPAVRRRSSAGYAASKAGVIALTESLARSLKADGVRVNCICPGGMGGSGGDEPFTDPPAGIDRPPHPGDVAYAALYFASNESAWITGQFLDVEGGTGL